jgi:hypothetical protein|eukprot:COSAG06_NODE_24066_length_673_cov_2.797909_2_plen_38_part_01
MHNAPTEVVGRASNGRLLLSSHTKHAKARVVFWFAHAY